MKGLINFVILLAIIGIVAFNGIYTLQDGETAVITRLGEYIKTEDQAGLKWKIPVIDQKYVVNTQQQRRMEFGYVTTDPGSSGRYAEYDDVAMDSTMITGDENLVDVTASIQYKIINPQDYLFNVDDQLGTLNVIAIATIRRSIANNELDDILTVKKSEISLEIKNDLQEICERYGLGIKITDVLLQDVDPPQEVDAAFKDIAQAQLDKESRINEAKSFENQVIPAAKGEASKLVSEAEAYKAQRVSEAEGDVANFNQVYEKYKDAVDVTRTRLYLETMAEILKDVEIFITKEDGNTLKFLPLQQGGLN
jgi:membrane protease subunit HflK